MTKRLVKCRANHIYYKVLANLTAASTSSFLTAYMVDLQTPITALGITTMHIGRTLARSMSALQQEI
jgi:hypothetical protein